MKKNAGIFLIIMMCTVCGGILVSNLIPVNADDTENETEEQTTVHINGDDIETSTLIIGTHLIYLGSLNEQIYATAKDSVPDVNRTDIYYKSELGGGKWYNISEAGGIYDISGDAQAVETAVINELEVRYHTKSDGITYDLLTGQPVSVFDIDNPYNLAENPDIEEIGIQQQLLESKEERTDSDNLCLDALNEFYAEDLSGRVTDSCDEALDKMQRSYTQLVGDEPELAQVLLEAMEKIDNTRRAETYDVLSEKLSELLDKISEDGSNASLIDAISSSIQNVADSETEYLSNRYEQGSEGEDSIQNKLMEELLAAMDSGLNVKKVLENIEAYNNVINGITKNPEVQLELINNRMIPEVMKELKNSLSGGTAGGNEGTTGGGQVSSADIYNLGIMLDKLYNLAKAGASRMSKKEAGVYLLEKIDEAEELKKLIADDLPKDKMLTTINSYIDDLESAYLGYADGSSGVLDYYLNEKEQLMLNKQMAIDNNDYQLAKQYNEKLDDVLLSIENEEARLGSIIASDTTTSAEKLDAQSQLGAGSAAARILDMKAEVMEDIDNSDFTSIKEKIEGISALAEYSPSLCKTALTDIYAGLAAEQILNNSLTAEQSDMIETAINAVTDAVTDNYDRFVAGNISSKDINELIDIKYGCSFNNLDFDKQVEVVLALAMYTQTVQAADFAASLKSLTTLMYNNSNPYVYLQLKNEMNEFIPIKIVCSLNPAYRYVYDDGLREAVLRRNTDYYKFQVLSPYVTRPDGKVEELTDTVRIQGDIYIPWDYAYNEFDLNCIYVENCDYAFVYTDEILDNSQELQQLLFFYSY